MVDAFRKPSEVLAHHLARCPTVRRVGEPELSSQGRPQSLVVAIPLFAAVCLSLDDNPRWQLLSRERHSADHRQVVLVVKPGPGGNFLGSSPCQGPQCSMEETPRGLIHVEDEVRAELEFRDLELLEKGGDHLIVCGSPPSRVRRSETQPVAPEEALDPSMASTEVWVGRSSQTERHDAENGWGTEALSVDPREDLIVDLVFDLPWKAEVRPASRRGKRILAIEEGPTPPPHVGGWYPRLVVDLLELARWHASRDAERQVSPG